MPGISALDLLAACDACTVKPVNTDKTWRTAKELAAESGLDTETVRRKLVKGIAGGVVKKERRYASTGSRVVLVDHYKIVKAR